MDEINETNSSPSLEFAEGYEQYVIAFASALRELEEIKQKERDLAYRKAKLAESVDALRPLVFKQAWDINALNLSDAIRFIFKTAKRSLSALEIRSKLEDLSYNLEQFDNPLANIHTALERMGETNELYRQKDGKKKMFEATSELKDVNEPVPDLSGVDALRAALKCTPDADSAIAENIAKLPAEKK